MIGLIIAAIIVAYILLIIFLPVVALSILALVLLALLVILFIPVGVDVSYVSSQFSLALKVGFYSHKLFPKEKDSEEPAEEKTDATESKPKKEKKKESSGGDNILKKLELSFDEIIEIIKKALKGVSKFGKLTVHEFMLHYIAAGKDPYSTAMTYNYVNAALSALAPSAAKVFKVSGDVDVWTDIDFTREKMLADARLCITLRLVQVVHVALVAGFGVLCVLVKNRIRIAKQRKTEKKQNKEINIQTEERMDSNG